MAYFDKKSCKANVIRPGIDLTPWYDELFGPDGRYISDDEKERMAKLRHEQMAEQAIADAEDAKKSGWVTGE